MGGISGSFPDDLIRELSRAGSIKAAIETGTWKGKGACHLSRVFDRVWTIEVLEDVHTAAQERNRDLSNVSFLQGSSPIVLRKLQTMVREPVLFWLDAHGGMFYSPDSMRPRRSDEPATSGSVDSQCPLLDELEVIDEFEEAKSSVVLIDDARAFMGPLLHVRAEDWPNIADVFDALRVKHPRFITVLDDVVIAVPLTMRTVVDDWGRQLLEREERSDLNLRHGLRHLMGRGIRRLAR